MVRAVGEDTFQPKIDQSWGINDHVIGTSNWVCSAFCGPDLFYRLLYAAFDLSQRSLWPSCIQQRMSGM
jgi:hypothetical protein